MFEEKDGRKGKNTHLCGYGDCDCGPWCVIAHQKFGDVVLGGGPAVDADDDVASGEGAGPRGTACNNTVYSGPLQHDADLIKDTEDHRIDDCVSITEFFLTCVLTRCSSPHEKNGQ